MSALSQTQRRAWCCVQAGHREQYGVPRALERAGILDTLVTDVWMPPGSLLARLAAGRLGRRLRDRFHPEVPMRKVHSRPWRVLSWEAAARLRLPASSRVIARNAWWSETAAAAMVGGLGSSTRFVFSYCYEARALFRQARRHGLTPILGQIDPGPIEDRLVTHLVRRWPRYRTSFQPGLPSYYEAWREECDLATHVIVNSAWSREALITAGIYGGKIQVVPLVYTPPPEAVGWRKTFPSSFTTARPLRVLFLGQCILRKGIAETIEAATLLADRPVEFTFVGNTDIANFSTHFERARIRYCARVSRVECHTFYREADLFLFPTHSDGFGLTQLEAQAWRLPAIVSRSCAEVVAPGLTGWVLPEVTAAAIAAAVEHALVAPAELARMSESIRPWSFTLEKLGRHLSTLSEEVA